MQFLGTNEFLNCRAAITRTFLVTSLNFAKKNDPDIILVMSYLRYLLQIFHPNYRQRCSQLNHKFIKTSNGRKNQDLNKNLRKLFVGAIKP